MWRWYLFQMAVMIAVGFTGIYFEQNIAHEHFGMAVPFLAAATSYLATLLLSRLIDWFSPGHKSSSRGRLDYRA
jgi:hypothetical protein